MTEFPSDPLDHTVRRQKPLDCWEELVFRVMRFGRRTQLQKGPRLELLNVKTIIMEPGDESEADLGQIRIWLIGFQTLPGEYSEGAQAKRHLIYLR